MVQPQRPSSRLRARLRATSDVFATGLASGRGRLREIRSRRGGVQFAQRDIAGRDFLPPEQASALEDQLRPVAARLRWRRTLETLPAAWLLFAAIVFWGVILARAFVAPGVLWLSVLGAAGVAVWAVGRVARRRVGPREAARSTDAALGLRERLATALELLDGQASGVLAELQVRDATAAAGQIAPDRAVPVFAPGSAARRTGLRRSGFAAAMLATALLVALWPSVPGGLVPDAAADKLALAQTGRPEDALAQPLMPNDDRNAEGIDGVDGRTDRPNQVGDQNTGQVGQPGQQNQPGQSGQESQPGQQGQPDSNQQAQADARSQQGANVAEREKALQDLGNALRQTQTGRQAGEALRSGDTARAQQQLSQVADQVPQLSPGERQSLAQAFQQASQDIGEKDRNLSEASARAADALQQFRNRDAQQAIREAANQVRDTGQQAQAQRDLEQRQRDLQSGGQTQLPGQPGQPQQGQQQQGRPGQQQGRPAQQPGQAGQAGQQSARQEGGGAASGSSLAELEADLRSGGSQGQGGGQGAGSGSGGPAQGEPVRVAVEARPVEVEAEVRPGPSQWRPPSPNSAPAAPPAASAAVPAGPASAAPIGAGPDVNSVPWEMSPSVREYFTPDQTRTGAPVAPAGQPAPSGAVGQSRP